MLIFILFFLKTVPAKHIADDWKPGNKKIIFSKQKKVRSRKFLIVIIAVKFCGFLLLWCVQTIYLIKRKWYNILRKNELF